MGESGPRFLKPLKKMHKKIKENPLIIDRPEAMGAFRKGTEWTITTISWAIWFVFLRPLVLVFLWYIGIRALYNNMFYLKGYKTLVEHSVLCILVIFGIYLVVRAWNLYNFLRFVRHERRNGMRKANEEELEAFFKLSSGSVSNIHGWKEITVSFHNNHKVVLGNVKDNGHSSFIGEFYST